MNCIHSNVYKELVEVRLHDFVHRYDNVSTLFYDSENKNHLVHAGEYGTFKERIVEELLRYTLPKRYSFCSGFVINHMGGRTKQCDLIIYDSQNSPFLEEEKNLKFVPHEIVYAIVEVKSKLHKTELFDALKKMAANKEIRPSMERVGCEKSYVKLDPIYNHNQSIMSILICDEIIGWNNAIDRDINMFYEKNDIMPCYRHNIICSLKNGIITYNIWEIAKIIQMISSDNLNSDEYQLYASPFFQGIDGVAMPLDSITVCSGDSIDTLKKFLSLINNCICHMDSFYPDPALYLY